MDHHNRAPAVCAGTLFITTSVPAVGRAPSALTWVGEFFSGRVWMGRGGGGGEIKRSKASFHWQTASVKDRGLMIGAARNIIYPESEDVWLQSSSPSSSGGTSSLYKCTIKMRCSHNTVSPSNAWPMSYQRLTCLSHDVNGNNNTVTWMTEERLIYTVCGQPGNVSERGINR